MALSAGCGEQLRVEAVTPRVAHRGEVVTIRFSRSTFSPDVRFGDFRFDATSANSDRFRFRVPAAAPTGQQAIVIQAEGHRWDKSISVTERSPLPVFTSVSSAEDQYCALDDAGMLWCWGTNVPDGFGLPADIPALVGPKRWRQVVVTNDSIVALSEEGAFFKSPGGRMREESCCYEVLTEVNSGGRSAEAFSHDGAFWPELNSSTLENAPRNFKKIAVTDGFGCAVGGDAQLLCWGVKNSHGQLGNGTTLPTTTPAPILENGPWVDVVAGEYIFGFACGLKADGALWCWGTTAEASKNPENGLTVLQSTPFPYLVTQVTESGRLEPAPPFDSLAASSGNVCAVSKGRIYCWGLRHDPGFGMVVPDDFIERPARVDSEGNWITVSPNIDGEICGVNSDGAIGCWRFLEAGNFSETTFVPVR